MVIALNMMDEMAGNGGAVKINLFEQLIEVPVVPISAAKNQGIDELVRHAVHIAKYDERPGRKDFCDKEDHGGALHRAMHAVMSMIEDHAEKAGVPVRFAASKIIEGDPLMFETLDIHKNDRDALERIVSQMEEERGLDAAAAMADMRFSFIRKVCDRTVIKPKESREHLRSQRIDRILTGIMTAGCAESTAIRTGIHPDNGGGLLAYLCCDRSFFPGTSGIRHSFHYGMR